MKTIKVIDLLIKIANGEELPKIIKYDDYILYYEKDMKDYYDNEGNHPLLDTQCQFILNDEIEIVEDTPKEDKKIEKLDLSDWVEITSSEDCKPEMLATLFNKNAIAFSSKINEIIDRLNGE